MTVNVCKEISTRTGAEVTARRPPQTTASLMWVREQSALFTFSACPHVKPTEKPNIAEHFANGKNYFLTYVTRS